MTRRLCWVLLSFTLVLFQGVGAYALDSSHHAGAKAESKVDAYQELLRGNARFVKGETVHPAQDIKSRQKLATGQTPHTIVLSCSDSRVPPELVFDQGLGQLFVVRVAGNALTDSVVASIEYAVEHLHSGQLLVMGHESCGAIKATLGTPEGKSAGSKDLDALVASIRPHLKGHTFSAEDKTFVQQAQTNVNGVIQDLLVRSPIVKEAVSKGHLSMLGGVYHLDSGVVDFWKK